MYTIADIFVVSTVSELNSNDGCATAAEFAINFFELDPVSVTARLNFNLQSLVAD